MTPQTIADRIRAEYQKHGSTIDEWPEIAAKKIMAGIIKELEELEPQDHYQTSDHSEYKGWVNGLRAFREQRDALIRNLNEL